ncbi:kinetochore component rough deal [Calliopsis andreniformis]|uniref:kinetochore component rough deal n=1 Tax=Calliopsis andreniformis TaxID=337506 RepID=UPI003FCDE07E
MALWNKVSSGFDKEEETVNFGIRTVAENNGSLYETSTIATIQSDGKVVKDPYVSASVQYTRFCVAIDKSVTIFENETCENIILNASFGLPITCYCISNDGVFLFVVLTNGVLYCLHLLNKGQVIFTKNITKNSDPVLKIFLQNQCNDYINMYLIVKSGAIYRISKINTKLIEAATLNETDTTLKELIEQIQSVQLFKGFSNNEVNYITVGLIGEEISIAMLCSNMLFMWPSEQYSNFNGLCYNYTKIEFFRKYITMLCLCKNGILHMVCPQTLLGLKVYQEPVSDFTIMENSDTNLCQILVLTRNDNCNINSLRVLSFPEFEQKFQINVPAITYLVEIMDPCNELVLFLEGLNDNENQVQCIDTIRIKTISESLPEYQLQRLLRKGQFDAAEAFAKKFNLSMEPIYCKKASLFLSKLDPWAKKDSDPVEVDTLLSIFDKIKNVQYVVECCSKALIPEYKQMRKIHLYAHARIIECDKVKNNNQLNLLFLINDTLHKLETFHMIWGYQENCEYYNDDIMKKWIRFSRASFIEEYKTHLSLGEMEAATLIWTRHLPDIIKHMSVETVKDIFATLPDDISPSCLWPWLSHFIPTLLSFIPDAMCEIILWGCKKIKSFEQLYRTSWLQIGIDFANKFIKLLRFEENSQSLYFCQEYLNKDSNLKQLVAMIQAMSDIQKLKANYRLTISLDLYIGDPIEVSFMLLDKIHVDLLPEFVNTFLQQYMLNNSLQHDYVCSSYIQKTINNSKSWWSGEEAPWEKRVVAIINLIQNIETKLQKTLEVLKKASVPWSSTMITLAETNSNLDHVLASQIRTEHNCVPIKLILKKYGYERIGINDKLICRIIRQNHHEMISHIQQITKNDPLLKKKAFSSCTNYYLSKGNYEKVMEILNSLETDILLYCCVQIINYVTASLTLKTIPKALEHYIEMFGWIKIQLKEISIKCKTQSHYCNDVIKNMDEEKSRYLLRKEFNINITLVEYYNKKEEILRKYIEQLYNVDMEEHNLSVTYKNVIKVADLLKLQRLNAVSLLLGWTKDEDIFKYFARSHKRPIYLMQDECKYIQKMCSLMLQYAKTDTNIASTVHSLISSALCVCSDEELQPMLILYIWANLYQECFNESTTYDPSTLNLNQEEMQRTNWKLYTIYKELAIAADEFLLPLFRTMISMQKFDIANSEVEHIKVEESIQNCNQLQTKESLKKLLDEMKKLNVEHNNYYLLQLIKTLYMNLCIMANVNSTLIMETRSVYTHYVIVMLKKLISTRTFDLQFGLSCLFMLSESEACKWISATCKLFQSDCFRHLRISIFGHEYFRLIKNQTFMQIYKDNKILHHWAQILSKYSISYKEVLTSDTTTKREILQRLMNWKGDNMISLFEKFCSDFGFDIQDCLLLYLQTIIKIWNPKLNITNLNGRKELNIHEDEINELRAKCNAVAAKIVDKAALKNCITSVYSQVNFYHYEIFIILMDLINDKNIEHRNYFCFLQNYTRTSQPTKVERDEWMHLNPEYTSLPPVAEWRLPFLPKIELWTLITPELNLKTYDKWLDIAPILKLQPHIICTLAIKGEVMNIWGNKHKVDKWDLYPKNTRLLNDIKNCIERMTGPNALYYGTAALYYVVNHAPPGANQVAAVEECYKYAQLSVQEGTTFETEILEKIKFKYLRFTSEHILHTHGLANKTYLSLIGNPHKLVRELYTDESIPKRYRCVTDHRPDINSAVNSISQLFSINTVKLQMELLQEWLQPEVKYVKLNQSITDTFSVTTNSEPSSNSDDNLLRARYILEHGDLELSANFLINIGFSDSKEDYNSEMCYKALQVLQALFDIPKLEDLTKRDYQTIRNYMKSLKYIGRLESLGINYSMSTFETCSKQELVQILWKTQSYSSQALVIIVQLCIDFEIYEYSIWDKTLTQLAKLLMTNELKKILLQVRNISSIVNSNGYLSGWQVVISEPFRKMYIHPTSEQIDDCIEILQLLYSCPVIHMLHFNDVIQYSFQCQQPHLAAALLPFLNDDDRKYVLDKIKDSFNVMKVLEDLNILSSNGILCIHYCNQIIQNTVLKAKV